MRTSTVTTGGVSERAKLLKVRYRNVHKFNNCCHHNIPLSGYFVIYMSQIDYRSITEHLVLFSFSFFFSLK